MSQASATIRRSSRKRPYIETEITTTTTSTTKRTRITKKSRNKKSSQKQYVATPQTPRIVQLLATAPPKKPRMEVFAKMTSEMLWERCIQYGILQHVAHATERTHKKVVMTQALTQYVKGELGSSFLDSMKLVDHSQARVRVSSKYKKKKRNNPKKNVIIQEAWLNELNLMKSHLIDIIIRKITNFVWIEVN